MRVLSPDEIEFFEQNGYVVVRAAVPAEQCQAVIDAIFGFLGMDAAQPDGWYREPHRTNGFVELYHHPSMWENRQTPRVYEAFAQLLGEEHLWVSIDRAGFKPPPHAAHPEYDDKGFVHWDAEPRTGRCPSRSRACSTSTTRARSRAAISACRGCTARLTSG